MAVSVSEFSETKVGGGVLRGRILSIGPGPVEVFIYPIAASAVTLILMHPLCMLSSQRNGHKDH